MKNSIQSLFTFVNSRMIKLAMLLLFPVFSFSQTFVNDASNPTDPGNFAGPTSAITPPAALAGDLVVMYAHYNANTPAITISNAAGQTWNTATAPAGSNNQSYAIFWCQFNGTWVGNPTVTVGAGGNAITSSLYIFRPAGGSNTQWVVHNPAVNTTSNATTNTITGVATTMTNTVTMAFWGISATGNSWGAPTGTGWSTTGLPNNIRNTSGTDQSMTAAYKISTAASAATNVSTNKTVAGTAVRSIITWAEQPINNVCLNAIPLNSGFTCVTQTGSLNNATYTAGGGIPGCGAANLDVWYSFVAKTPNPTITTTYVSGSGQRRTELFSGACGALTSPVCSGNTNNLVASGLTVGQTYYVRVYSENASSYNYTICVTDPLPTNDACASPAPINHTNTCTYTSGNMFGATVTANPPLTPCTGPATYDLWYSFVAQDNNATVDLANVGSAITGARIQLLTNSCTGSAVNNGCGDEATSITTSSLTIGTTYYVRVYGTGTAPVNALNAGFDVCVTYPTLPPPTNDNCPGAVTLLNNPSCSNTVGTMANATLSGYTIGGTNCAAAATYDVWYRFTASITNPVITLSGGANNFTNRGIQLLSGTCGTTPTFTSIACNATSISGLSLTVGNIYYIRVYSTTAGPAPAGNANFSLCVNSVGQPLKFGNSYVNVTKKTTGGVVEPGDILEIRMTIAHTSGTMYNMRYMDNLPTNTVYDSTSNINIITNEGIVVPSKTFTWAGGDDAAMFTGTPGAGEYNIRMNIGFSGTAVSNVSATGTTNAGTNNATMIAASDIPKGTGTSMLFATSFRVKVTGAVGDVITLGTGQFRYATTNNGADNILTATPYQIQITSPLSLCANSTGVNMSQESGGTFGSGPTLNRPYDLATPIPSYTFVNISAAQGLGDGQYSIVKNMSPRGGIDSSADRVGNCVAVIPAQDACAMRMHTGHWEVDGDHTGSNNYTGNAPTANGAPGGYMLMVNADYVASEVYRQTITDLCPNTYYEFSAWFRNICKSCGNDYTTGGNYTPLRQPGVLPNLTFALDGLDRYNTGEIPFEVSGQNNGWVKKGFVFVTGPTQTSATFSIRNNSQGGGGNDWVMDDIAVATCLPNMSYTPTLNPVLCLGNSITLQNTITSYFPNYTHYKWQRSLSGGGAWTDIPGQTGSATASAVPGGYSYVVSYPIPLADAQLANDGDRYRVIVATTTDNLSDLSCNVTDGVSIIDITVMDCTPILSTELISFSGKLVDDKGLLTWVAQNEEAGVKYIVERSSNGTNFQYAGTLSGRGSSTGQAIYNFADPVSINGKVWYRLQLLSPDNKKKYSSIIQLTNNLPEFDFVKVVNPFTNALQFDVAVKNNSLIHVDLIDMSGRLVRSQNQVIYAGINSLNLTNTASLPAGVYTLKVTRNEKTITKRVIKTN